MTRRRPPTSTRALRTDFVRLVLGLCGLAVLGFAIGGAVSAFRMDGTPVKPPSFSERPLPVEPRLHVATAAPQDSLPVPEAQGGPAVDAQAAGLPAPVVADAGPQGDQAVAEKVSDPSVAALPDDVAALPDPTAAPTITVKAGVDDILAAGPAPAPAEPAAAAPGSVPQPRLADHEIAPHRLAPQAAAPFQLASFFLRPSAPGGDRRWGRTEDLLEAFSEAGYDLRRIRAGDDDVPRLFVGALPDDLRHVRQPERRKRIFIKTVLPLILRANQEVLSDRRRLQALIRRQAAGTGLTADQEAWLSALADRYGADRYDGTPEDAAGLLSRVDIVPVSLALAQAAEESGWGTSRFARQGNAVFGQWTWDTEAGIVPRDRPRGRSHLVRKFPALQLSVSAYIDNLNSNPAYASFRRARARQRAKGEELDGRALAGHLTAYSQRGADYVRTLRTIIGHDDLHELDTARLSESATPWTARFAGGVLQSVF